MKSARQWTQHWKCMQYLDAFDAGEAYFKENVDIKQQLFDLDPSVGRSLFVGHQGSQALM